MQEVKWQHSALAYDHKIFYLWSAATTAATTYFFFNFFIFFLQTSKPVMIYKDIWSLS